METDYENVHYVNYEIPTGAFEVFFMGICLYSKIDTGKFPQI